MALVTQCFDLPDGKFHMRFIDTYPRVSARPELARLLRLLRRQGSRIVRACEMTGGRLYIAVAADGSESEISITV
jgi:hypothetical protein